MKTNKEIFFHMAKILGPQSLVVDIGAYDGKYSKELCKRSQGDPSRWHLIEPCPKNYRALSARCGTFRRYQMAIGRDNTSLTLYTAKRKGSEGSSKSNSIYADYVGSKAWVDKPNEIQVKALSLDWFIKQNKIPKIDFLKLNCEGGEYAIFSSETFNFLDKTRYIYLQLHGKEPVFLTREIWVAKQLIVRGLEREGYKMVIGDKLDIDYKNHFHQLWHKNTYLKTQFSFLIQSQGEPGSE